MVRERAGILTKATRPTNNTITLHPELVASIYHVSVLELRVFCLKSTRGFGLFDILLDNDSGGDTSTTGKLSLNLDIDEIKFRKGDKLLFRSDTLNTSFEIKAIAVGCAFKITKPLWEEKMN